MIDKKIQEQLRDYPWPEAPRADEAVGIRIKGNIYYICPRCETLKCCPWGFFQNGMACIQCSCSSPMRCESGVLVYYGGDVLEIM